MERADAALGRHGVCGRPSAAAPPETLPRGRCRSLRIAWFPDRHFKCESRKWKYPPLPRIHLFRRLAHRVAGSMPRRPRSSGFHHAPARGPRGSSGSCRCAPCAPTPRAERLATPARAGTGSSPEAAAIALAPQGRVEVDAASIDSTRIAVLLPSLKSITNRPECLRRCPPPAARLPPSETYHRQPPCSMYATEPTAQEHSARLVP